MLSDSCVYNPANRGRRASGAAQRTRKRIWQRVTLTAIAASSGAASLHAADVSWDNGSSNSIWDTTSLNWSGAAWSNAAGDGALFGATGAGAISVPGPINVNSMHFTAPGYSLNGAGPFTFVDGTSTQTTGVVTVESGASAQINVPINSAVGFQKIGAGTLVLGGSGSSFTGAIPLNPRGTLVADVLVGGSFGTINGGFLQLASAAAMPASARVSIGNGYLDIGSNSVTVSEINFTNENPSAAWNTTLNANNGVIGNGTLRVTGEIGVQGKTADNNGNTIAANLDLGGGTQILRVGVVTFAAQERALMLTGVVSNGSLLKTYGYNHNGVLTNTDGISLLNNNTYTGSTVLNAGVNVVTGTNATSSIKMAGVAGGASGGEVRLQGANGSAQSATLLQAFDGGNFILDNNAALGASGFNQPNVPAAQNNDRIRDDATVELRYGSFTYRGLAGSTTASETFGSLNVLGGHNTVTIAPNNLGAATVTGTGNLTMAPRATLQVQTVTTGTGNSGNLLGGNAQLKFNGSVPTADATGILPRTVGTTSFMTYDATNGMTPLPAASYATDFSTAGTNVTNAASTNVTSSVNINALRSTAGSNTTITVDPGQTLGITSGMILNSAFGGLTITGGVLDFGANPGTIFATGAVTLSGTVTGSSGLIHARGTGTFSGDFSGLTGPVDIYGGTANINNNTMSGPINIRGGQLNINTSQTAAGLGPIRFGSPDTDSNLIGLLSAISISGAGVNAIIDRDLIVDNGTANAAGVALTYRQASGLSPLSNTTGSQTWSGDVTLNTSLRLQGGGAGGTGATNFTGDITGAGTFFIPNGRANFSGTYSNAGGFNLGDQGFSMKVAFLGTPGSGPLTISGGNSNTVSYNAGALPSGPIRVWNSLGTTAPQIIPLQTSTINNSIFLDNSFASGGGDAIANVGTGIDATWAGPLTGAGALTKIGTGVLSLSNAGSTYAGRMIVNDGVLLAEHAHAFGTPTLTVNGGTARLAPGLGTAMTLRGVTVNLAAGKFDITNNAVVVDYTPPDASPVDSIRAAIASGYNGGGAGAWTGNGITTSNGNASEFGIGYAEASALTTIPSIFGSVDATAVLLRHTRYGDADLNGLVNLDDFNRLAANFGGVNKVWSQGDFDYNGNVNLDDFNMLAGNFGLSAGPDGVVGPDDWAALASAVPEPGSAVPLLATALACLRRRRRSASAKC